ncbi:MAG TPA: hypothetical protein VM891_07090 [Amaricoccus sp.]|nr:hypothetical protein [Amaricoccus sp.]
MTQVRVWLSHDGYRDPDDNLSMLLGAANARVAAQSSSSVRVGGVLFGDTKDGGQYYTLNPGGTAPAAFGTDDRYGDVAGNKQAAGNYAFFQQYGKAALKALGPGWKLYDLLASDNGGRRAWNFDASQKSQITGAAQALADDIVDALTQTGAAATPAKLVVYSAGGGANAAAEAIGYLLNQGYAEADLLKVFVVVQHGNNWVTNYEGAARELTRDFTVAISNQNYDLYANGDPGPDLKHALSAKVTGDTLFAAAFDTALAVATGGQAFGNLPANATFKATLDASDAGSHAFATNPARLIAAMADRLSGGEGLQTGYDWAHLIDTGTGTGTSSGARLREIVSDFDAAAISKLLWGSAGAKAKVAAAATTVSPAASAEAGHDAAEGGAESATGGGRSVVALASGSDDRESLGGSASTDLDLGTAAGGRANRVTLHFGDLAELAADLHDAHAGARAEIESAYLVFEAKRGAGDDGPLTIAAAGESVDWDPGAWTAGASYRSADVAALVEAALAGDGNGDHITFAITGSGSHVAEAFEADGAAPRLVIDWDLA